MKNKMKWLKWAALSVLIVYAVVSVPYLYATSLATKYDLKFSHTYTDSLDLSTITDSFSRTYTDTLANGTSANQADLIFHDSRTLTATSEDLDLAGVLSDAFGNTLTYVEVVGFAIKNTSTTTTENLAVGGAASAQFINWVGDATDIVNIGPDGIFFLWNPDNSAYTVTATTGDLLRIDSGADNITYEIIIWGRSA